MIISNFGNRFDYELEKLTRLFLPFERITVIGEASSEPRRAVTVTDQKGQGCDISAEVFFDGRHIKRTSFLKKDEYDKKTAELALAGCLFECLVDIFAYKPRWGILTGVRPARLYLHTLGLLGPDGTKNYFKEVLRVDPSKLSLLEMTAHNEQRIISLSKPESYSLYISVPFCPTRCAYCSFVSHSVERAADLIEPYLKKLLVELKITADTASKLGLRLETVYIGGGTPTTLSADRLDNLLSAVADHFDLDFVREFTVEAGRPDTLTAEKLAVLKNHKVSRISINPQTLNDSVLLNIGRRHTARDFLESFDLARACGFDNINTDLIAGLPGDTLQSFASTLKGVKALDPESVTVHSLSLKRSSSLTAEGFEPLIAEGDLAARMVDLARTTLSEGGWQPYYLYRQSKTVGNLENVGYSKPGREGLYNVYIMDETHTVLACGASAATKLKNYNTGQIKRIFNFKYPYEYISRFDEQIDRKIGIWEFYNSL